MPNYFNPYSYQPNYFSPYNQPPQAAPQRCEVVRVNGRNGAEAYQMAPNSQILLLDESAPVVWLKTTDGAGYPTVTPYSISPMQTQTEKDAGRLDAIEKRISDIEVKLNDESNNRNAKPRQVSRIGATDTAD